MSLEGPNHPNWKGGHYISKGYMMVRIAKNTYVREHRLIMERHLGRPLERHEVVHHINGDKLDNRIENLVVVSNPGHTKHHWDTEGKELFGHTDTFRPAECHPERRYYAKGLCHQCYNNAMQKQYYKENRDKILARQKKRRATPEYRAKRSAYKKRRRKLGYGRNS